MLNLIMAMCSAMGHSSDSADFYRAIHAAAAKDYQRLANYRYVRPGPIEAEGNSGGQAKFAFAPPFGGDVRRNSQGEAIMWFAPFQLRTRRAHDLGCPQWLTHWPG